MTLVMVLGLWTSLAAGAQPARNCVSLHTMLDSVGSVRATTVRYFDGLGRLEESVAVGASPAGADLVSLCSRDRAGRIVRQYGAVPSEAGGAYVGEAGVQSLAAGAYSDSNPYTLTEYEQSPLGRRLAVTGAGWRWHSAGKAVTTAYHTNLASRPELRCRRLTATDTRLQSGMAVTVTDGERMPTARCW